MARSKSSSAWLAEHFADVYVKRAQQEGYRSRAIYKLQEIDQRDRLLRPGMTIVDLGAAPGGWSQYALERVGAGGRVVALDILPMAPIAGGGVYRRGLHRSTSPGSDGPYSGRSSGGPCNLRYGTQYQWGGNIGPGTCYLSSGIGLGVCSTAAKTQR